MAPTDINIRSPTLFSAAQLILFQPSIEFTFSPAKCSGEVSFACDERKERLGQLLLSQVPSRAIRMARSAVPKRAAFSEVSAGWVPAEDDSDFLCRLKSAVVKAGEFPAGKMILTRSYALKVRRKRSMFALYELYGRITGEYACSHFVCIDRRKYSIGCTPENVFEVYNNRLEVDVVASTCDAATRNRSGFLKKLLYNDKQIKEHRMALERRLTRFARFCEGGSVRAMREMKIKKLRRVFHLHSVIRGQLLPGTSLVELLESSFPPLTSYPIELISFADTDRTPHRFYGGFVGHTHAGSTGCFLNIRNVLSHDDMLYAKVGIGVIRESDAEKEFIETLDKVSGIMEAIHFWENGSFD